MLIHKTVFTVAALAMFATAGCAVTRGQQSVGDYVDDAGITASVKARLLENENVAGTSISVETLNGTVMLSGFAKSQSEMNIAESLTRQVAGVTSIENQIVVRP
jgi:hyperosmotically inducible periplasmic protein